MKRPKQSHNNIGPTVEVPTDSLNELLEAIWQWAYEDYQATPAPEREAHIFNAIIRLDSALHGVTIDESWKLIQQYQDKQEGTRK